MGIGVLLEERFDAISGSVLDGSAYSVCVGCEDCGSECPRAVSDLRDQSDDGVQVAGPGWRGGGGRLGGSLSAAASVATSDGGGAGGSLPDLWPARTHADGQRSAVGNG